MGSRHFIDRILLHDRAREAVHHLTEVTLRLPGVLLLEIWWRNRDFEITPEWLQKSPFSSYLEMDKILEFIQTRDFDQSAALVLSYAVVFLFSMFLLLPLTQLFGVYAHATSLFLFGVAHCLSIRYVLLEQKEDPDLRLDDLTKFERHGSHILAQLLLCVAQSCLLGLESDVARISLTVFFIPILARTCGISLEWLMFTHNLACSLAMLSICIYVLNRAPRLLASVRHSYRSLKAVLMNRGIFDGIVAVWHNLYFGELLSCAWMTLFFVQIYVIISTEKYSLSDFGAVVLSATAESTSTPLSLLALALTVSSACKTIVRFSRWSIGANYESNHFLVHGGYTEALALVLLCSQTGFLGMRTEQKAFLLGLVILIVLSSLLQSLYELLEPRLLELAATPVFSFERNLRCLTLAMFLLLSTVLLAIVIIGHLPADLWCVIIVSNSVLTTLRTFSVTVVYALIVLETQKPEFWESCDDFIFYTKIGTRVFELGFAFFVVFYGVYASIEDHWTLVSSLVLIFHTYFNIWHRLQGLVTSIRARRAAIQNLSRLPRASISVLEKRKDVCAICFGEMLTEARITPCKHFFHGSCLKKWLSVKQVCPLCYAVVSLTAEGSGKSEAHAGSDTPVRDRSLTTSVDSEENDESSEWDSGSSVSDFTEYTVVSSDGADSTP